MKISIQKKKPGEQSASEHENQRLAPMMMALKAIHSAAFSGTMTMEELQHQRDAQERLGKFFSPMLGMKWEPFQIGAMQAAWVRPERPHDRQHVVFYCHGGGYTSGNLGYSRPLASKLAHATDWETLCFEYRLAPEHPFPAAADDAVKAWDYLMHLGYGARDVVVAGDSAGGNLALVLCHRLKAEGRRLPAKLVLMSPWTDMTASGKSYDERAELDPTITRAYIQSTAAAYAAGRDLHDTQLSPLLGDFSGFPPTLVQVGSNEILLSDSVELRSRMRSAEVSCKLEIWQDMWHVFQMFPIRRAGQAMDSIGRFILEERY